jgi:aminopeptidase-like protein
MFHLDIFAEILKLNIGVSQADNEKMFALLNTIYPLSIHRYASGKEHNGWVVPHNWVVKKALIKKDGKVLFDGTQHPLAVAGYAPSFHGKISKQELDEHVFTRPELPNAYSYHCMNNYRPWARFWGFTMPHNIYKDWTDGEYEIELETEYQDGEMLVGEAFHQGESDETIVFNAHTCHPTQFNDDLAGVAVILELFKHLKGKKTHYSYRGIFAPEHLGTVFYLGGLPDAEIAKMKMGAFVEMVGIDLPLALAQSFNGTSLIDKVAEYAMKQVNPETRVGAFRTIVGNDETVWEGAGIEIPFISISRCHKSPFYYTQYHTNEDDLSLNSVSRLEETLTVLKNMVNIFENNKAMRRKFKGLLALSNPKHDLYIERPDPTVAKDLSEVQLKMGYMQDYLQRLFDEQTSVFDIAQRFDVPFEALSDYLKKFEAKGLIEFLPISLVASSENISQN